MEDFWDEYWDDFREPSEAEEIVDGAIVELENLLKSEVKDSLSKWHNAQAKLDESQRELDELEYKIGLAEQKVKQLEEKANNLDTEEIPRRYMDTLARKYTGGMAPGDKVWAICYRSKHFDCPMCKGKGKVSAKVDGVDTKVRCPKCDGQKTLWVYERYIEQRTVADVRLRLTFPKENGWPVRAWTTECIKLCGRDDYETKNGIYLDQEEAQKACDKLNKENA